MATVTRYNNAFRGCRCPLCVKRPPTPRSSARSSGRSIPRTSSAVARSVLYTRARAPMLFSAGRPLDGPTSAAPAARCTVIAAPSFAGGAYTICRVCDFCQECDASCCPLCVPLEVCVVCGVASCPSLLVVCTSCGKGACDHCLSVQPSWNCEGRGTDREGDVGCDQKCCPNCRVAPAPHTRCAYCAKNMCSHCLADPDHGCAT